MTKIITYTCKNVTRPMIVHNEHITTKTFEKEQTEFKEDYERLFLLP